MKRQWIRERKMFAQEDFIPSLVHKLNTHLAPLIAYGQLLLPKVGNRESKGYVEKIVEETQQASQLIKDLVNFVRRRNPKKEVVDLNRLIEKVLETKIPRLNFKNIEVVEDLSISIPRTLTDAKTALAIIGDRDFDFVICDIRMPEMSGIEFYSIIKEKKPSYEGSYHFFNW